MENIELSITEAEAPTPAEEVFTCKPFLNVYKPFFTQHPPFPPLSGKNPFYPRSFFYPNPFLPGQNPFLYGFARPYSTPNNVNSIKTAYNVPTNIVPLTGVKTSTISIVVAYSYPNLLADLNTFCNRLKLPMPSSNQINIVNLNSSNSPPTVNQNIQGWYMESCLDLQYAYAMNPKANINVIQAVSDLAKDLMNAVQFANNNITSDIVSMSWGGNDFQGENNYISYFSKPTTCYLASSGDSAAQVNFPSCLSNVLSCGGTSLDFTGNVRNEKCWSSAGCGVSKYITKPAFQNNIIVLKKYNNRCTPDICAVADPATGVFICFQNKFIQIGGTSLSCPLLAGILSISSQDRINKKKTPLTTVLNNNNSSSLNITNILYNIYQSSSSAKYVNDITTGNDGGFVTQKGFDIPTGLGSLNAGNLINMISNM